MKRSFAFTYPCPRKMREIVKLSLLEREPPSRIKEIWNEYHGPRPTNVSTVISAHQFELFLKRSMGAPYFVFPVARKGGHFMLLAQSQGTSNLFTYLEDFKRSSEAATPYFVLTLFSELKVTKQIVPVRGDIVDHKVTKAEAATLMTAFLAHYIEGGLFEETVRVFNHEPDRFNYQKFTTNYIERFGKH